MVFYRYKTSIPMATTDSLACTVDASMMSDN
jgi:hypothetical protein